MTQRERILSLAVGGLLVAVVFQWAFSKYRDALRFRQNRLFSLNNQIEELQGRWLEGARAERIMGEYKARSLSSDPETAQSRYQSWLLETVGAAGLKDATVDPIGDIPVGDLYRRFGFRLSGKTNLEDLVTLIHNIEAKDYLHRVRELNFGPSRTGGLNVEMTLDVAALSIADTEPTEPDHTSWRITKNLADSQQAILNRNFFQPPNQPPSYTGQSNWVAFRGQSNELTLTFADPEKSGVDVELASELPEWASFDPGSGKLRMTPPAPTPAAPTPAVASPPDTESADAVPETTDPSDALDDPENTTEDTGSTPTAPASEDTPESQDAPASTETLEKLEVRIIATDRGYPRRQITQQLAVSFQDPPPPAKPPEPPPGFDDATQTFLTALVQSRDDWTAWMNVRTRGMTLKLKVGDEFEIGSVRGTVTEVNAKRVLIEIDGKGYELRPAEKLSEAVKD